MPNQRGGDTCCTSGTVDPGPGPLRVPGRGGLRTRTYAGPGREGSFFEELIIEQIYNYCYLLDTTRSLAPAGTHVGDSDCVGGVLAHSCSGADLRQPGSHVGSGGSIRERS